MCLAHSLVLWGVQGGLLHLRCQPRFTAIRHETRGANLAMLYHHGLRAARGSFRIRQGRCHVALVFRRVGVPQQCPTETRSALGQLGRLH